MNLKSLALARLRRLPSPSKLNTLCDQLDKRSKELVSHKPDEARVAVLALCRKIVWMKFVLDKTPLKKDELNRVARLLADKIMDHAHIAKAAGRRGA